MVLRLNGAKSIIVSVFNDKIARNVFIISCAICGFSLFLSLFTGIIVIIFSLATCIFVLHVIDNPRILDKLTNSKICKKDVTESANDCGVCGDYVCLRKNSSFDREPWKQIKITRVLDDSVDNFFSHILNKFINSWFSTLSHDKNFICSLKQNLREALCRLILRIQNVNYPIILTDKLFPVVFSHLEIIKKITLEEKVQMDRVVSYIVLNEYPIHPATLNRQNELNYLRNISKSVIPHLFSTSSLIVFNLVKEILACWVLLPVLDAVSDPNLLNLVVILATTKSNPSETSVENSSDLEKVIFLENFVKRSGILNNSRNKKVQKINDIDVDENFLKDQQKLYSFMQYLKREGSGVDLLKFYLDVEHLNSELNDPRIISDPCKLSAMAQQSENLLKTYRVLFKNECRGKDLNDAFEHVKSCLKLKWKNDFCKSLEYFILVYGDNTIKEKEDAAHSTDSQSHSSNHNKFSSKLKEAISFKPVDGLEAVEIPTVWDGIWDPEPSSSSHHSPISTKLRRERGQNLNSFMKTLINSIEQSVEHGEDVVKTSEEDTKPVKQSKKLGKNVLYGNLFDLKTSSTLVNHETTVDHSYSPSKSLTVLMTDVIKVPDIFVRILASICQLMGTCVDNYICSYIRKTTKKLLDEVKLAKLISLLEEKIFGDSTPAPSAQELTKRRELAHERLESLKSGTGETLNYLQSPILNKQLIYCLLDIIIAELFPEIIDEKDAKDLK